MKLSFLMLTAAAGAMLIAWGGARAADELPAQFQGNPPICPRWAFEPWVWEDNGNTREHVMGLVEGYQSRDIPVGAVIVDSPWSTSYNSFEWDAERYPQPEQMIKQLNERGVRVVLWITGMMNSESKDTPQDKPEHFDEVIDRGLVVDDGKQYKWWKGRGTHIDFTNPEACEWFGQRLDRMMAMGVDGWKVDQAEHYLADMVQTSIGEIEKSQFKPYYYAQVRDRAYEHNRESLIFARPYSHQGGFAASRNKCTVGWCGDYSGDFAGLRKQMQNLYKSANAGYGALAVEVGGFFRDHPTKQSLIRYAQFGALMPVMVNGGENGGLTEHLPWHHDEQTVAIYRYYATLHSELAPYIFSCSVDSHLHGGSIVKDADNALHHHRLGEWVYASVVVDEATQKQVRLLDSSEWIDYWDQDRVREAGATYQAELPLERAAIHIKPGAIIPMDVTNDVTGHGDASSGGKQTIVIYPHGQSSYVFHRPRGSGIAYDDVTIAVDEQGGTIEVAGEIEADYRIRVKCFARPGEVRGGTDRYDAKTKWLQIDRTGSSFTIEIDGLRGYATR